MISFDPARNYRLKVSNSSTRIRRESCSILRMSMLAIFKIKDVNGVVLGSLVLTVNIFALIADFEQTNVCLIHIEKANIFEDRIGHIMRYVLY